MPKVVDRDRYRQELLKQCFDLFAQRGYGSLTMRQIAAKIGVSTGTLYHYFSSKEELFIQLIEEIIERDILYANETIKYREIETLGERVKAMGNFIAQNEDYFHKETFLFINFLQQPELEQTKLIEAIKSSYKRYQEEIVKLLGIEDRAIASYICCFIDGLITQRVFAPELTIFEEQIELLAQMLTLYNTHQSSATSS
jgi:AcrR family transcriptional regulator